MIGTLPLERKNMTTAVEKEPEVYMHGRDRNFTEEEYEQINKEFDVAEKRGDETEMFRIFSQIPMSPKVVRAFAKVLGKELLFEINADLTEANREFGEGWLDEMEN